MTEIKENYAHSVETVINEHPATQYFDRAIANPGGQEWDKVCELNVLFNKIVKKQSKQQTDFFINEEDVIEACAREKFTVAQLVIMARAGHWYLVGDREHRHNAEPRRDLLHQVAIRELATAKAEIASVNATNKARGTVPDESYKKLVFKPIEDKIEVLTIFDQKLTAVPEPTPSAMKV